MGTLLRNIAWEAASQIDPRNYSKEVREKAGYIEIFYIGVQKKFIGV